MNHHVNLNEMEKNKKLLSRDLEICEWQLERVSKFLVGNTEQNRNPEENENYKNCCTITKWQGYRERCWRSEEIWCLQYYSVENSNHETKGTAEHEQR